MTELGGDLLEAVFAEMREAERAGVPEIESLLGRLDAADRARASRGWAWAIAASARFWTVGRLRVGLAAGVVAAAVVAAVVTTAVQANARSRDFEETLARAATEAQLGSWTAPSDFLLEVPGRELYASLPRIETDWSDVTEVSFDTIPPRGR